MDLTVPGALVEGYRHRIESLILPDPGDRHVLAAAIEAGADLILTFNARHFPRHAVIAYGIDVIRPDAFLLELLTRDAAGVHAAMRTHRAELRHPPYDVAKYLANLERVGLRRTAEAVRRSTGDL